eukprot:scaffold325848_cov61-Tisochrysis_lutea.AAC.1
MAHTPHHPHQAKTQRVSRPRAHQTSELRVKAVNIGPLPRTTRLADYSGGGWRSSAEPEARARTHAESHIVARLVAALTRIASARRISVSRWGRLLAKLTLSGARGSVAASRVSNSLGRLATHSTATALRTSLRTECFTLGRAGRTGIPASDRGRRPIQRLVQ